MSKLIGVAFKHNEKIVGIELDGTTFKRTDAYSISINGFSNFEEDEINIKLKDAFQWIEDKINSGSRLVTHMPFLTTGNEFSNAEQTGEYQPKKTTQVFQKKMFPYIHDGKSSHSRWSLKLTDEDRDAIELAFWCRGSVAVIASMIAFREGLGKTYFETLTKVRALPSYKLACDFIDTFSGQVAPVDANYRELQKACDRYTSNVDGVVHIKEYLRDTLYSTSCEFENLAQKLKDFPLNLSGR